MTLIITVRVIAFAAYFADVVLIVRRMVSYQIEVRVEFHVADGTGCGVSWEGRFHHRGGRFWDGAGAEDGSVAAFLPPGFVSDGVQPVSRRLVVGWQ